MKTVPADEAYEKIQKYLKNDVATPFFVVVDDSDEYKRIKKVLNSLAQIRVSDFCVANDTFPDYDKIYDTVSKVKEDTLLLGLGESVRLGGDDNIIGRLKNVYNYKKVVILCRGIIETINSFCMNDKKFKTERNVCFIETGTFFEVVRVSKSLHMAAENGFKALLRHLEEGDSGTMYVKTDLHLKNVREINSAYQAIQLIDPTFPVRSDCIKEDLWVDYLSDRSINGYDLFHWRNFLSLKMNPPENIYLKHVISKSEDFETYKRKFFSAIFDFRPDDKKFNEMYYARKILLKNIKDNEIAEYVTETKIKDDNRIFYLTDNTNIERQAIIESLDGKSTIPESLSFIYPALSEYLQDFKFIGKNGDLFTSYFSEYKFQKVTNRLFQDFHNKVISLAADGNRPYNSLKTRGEVLDSLNKNKTALYWMDALGAEYIGYLQCQAKKHGLKITVHVVRANLPTITSFNSDFYETCNCIKVQNKQLDEIKHNGELDFNYEITKAPIHLATELQIIDKFLEWTVSKLSGHFVEKVILVSDHGASRLAVINEKECQWEMTNKGQHSGRCCPSDETDIKSNYVTQENDFWVLANYDRFKGGRRASVEVHGGATLEEVIVPIIEFELFSNPINVVNMSPIIKTSFKKNAEIILFSTSQLENVSINIKNRYYLAEAIGNQKYRIIMEDIKKSDKYKADVFEGDNFIGQIDFEVQRESAKTNDSDWF